MTLFGAYLHCDSYGHPFYVGKGTRSRALSLSPAGRSTEHASFVKAVGRDHVLVGFIPCSSEKTAFSLERGILKCLKRSCVAVVNKTAGGQGVSGRSVSIDTRTKIAAALRGVSKPSSTRARISAALKGRPPHERLRITMGRSGEANGYARSVICTDGVKTLSFGTVTAAAEYFGCNIPRVCKAVKFKRKISGWSFNYGLEK